jgi:sarcosine oxidase
MATAVGAVVVGGGVMGAAAAWRLASRGVPVTLLEQSGPSHERGASHGSARIFRLAYDRSDYVALAQRSLSLWRDLERSTGAAILTTTGGVDHGDPVQLAALRAALEAGGARASMLDPGEASALWPGLRFDGGVLWQPDAGRLHADRAVAALKAAAAALGAVIRHDTPVQTITERSVTTEEGEELLADHVVVAAGGWTHRLIGAVVDDLPPLRVTLEQPAHFAPLDPAAPWPSFIHHPGSGLAGKAAVYGLGSDDGVKVGFHKVGPEIDPDQDDRLVDTDRLAALRDYVAAWVPGVDAATAEPLTCTYTLTPDEHFVVDRRRGITVLAGFSGHGFKFAPAIGELAAGLALDGDASMPPFALGARTPPGAPPVIR